jgi:hypothetical protein
MPHDFGERIPGWTELKPTPEQDEACRQIKAATRRKLADEHHQDWTCDPVRIEMGRALDREHRNWRQYGDDEDALRAIQIIVNCAMRQWHAQAAQGRTGRAGNLSQSLTGIDRIIARGILRAWKDPRCQRSHPAAEQQRFGDGSW